MHNQTLKSDVKTRLSIGSLTQGSFTHITDVLVSSTDIGKTRLFIGPYRLPRLQEIVILVATLFTHNQILHKDRGV